MYLLLHPLSSAVLVRSLPVLKTCLRPVLDGSRSQKKAKTELDWATRTANELDIEVDSSGRGGDEDDEAMEERRGRKRKKIGGKVGGHLPGQQSTEIQTTVNSI